MSRDRDAGRGPLEHQLLVRRRLLPVHQPPWPAQRQPALHPQRHVPRRVRRDQGRAHPVCRARQAPHRGPGLARRARKDGVLRAGEAAQVLATDGDSGQEPVGRGGAPAVGEGRRGAGLAVPERYLREGGVRGPERCR